MRIHRLPDTLINQIAAGEVVERPSSALKELVENSLDAQAHRIDIFLKEGGIEEIQILDDGIGMEPDDLLLSVERHATSKLQSVADLDSIGTFGFRGEALSAIASVSEMEIRSRTTDSPQAYLLRVAYGIVNPELTPESGPVGTCLRVRGLFSRIPARQKFLRSFSTEFSHCAKVVREIALGNPDIDFFLHHQGRLIHAYAKAGRLDRFKECLAPTYEPIHFCDEGDAYRAEGFFSPPDHTQDRGEVLLYINGRGVRHKTLSAAIRNTYLELLGPGHEPSGVLYLEIRKDWVDVNVHPQKLEVRLLRQEMLYQWLSAAVRKLISQTRAKVTVPPFSDSEDSEQGSIPFLEARPLSGSTRSLRYLGSTQPNYLLCTDAEGLVIVDPHALHAQLIFGRLRAQFERQELRIQPNLIPKVVRLSADQISQWEKYRAPLSQCGFDIESFGDGDIAVKSRPELLDEHRVDATLEHSLANLAALGATPGSSESVTRAILNAVACQSAISADQPLSSAEAERLLPGLSQIDEEWSCLHGRKVSFRLRFQTIEKHFEKL